MRVDAAEPPPACRRHRQHCIVLPCADNEQEDFLLSAYDATCSLNPASARALRAGDASRPLLLAARYLPMGAMRAVEEGEVVPERLRLPPCGGDPFAVYGGG